MLASELAARISEQVDALNGRVKEAADLQELLRQKALPQAPVSAFVLPLGLNPRNRGEAATGMFLQEADEVFGVVLVVRAAGDVTGGKALPKVDELVWAALEAVCGWGPADAIGVFRLVRGQLLKADAGSVQYQLDFGLPQQVRVLS